MFRCGERGANDGGAHIQSFATYGDTGYLFSEEARRTLSDSVRGKIDAFARRAAASRAATCRPKGKKASDSAILIRKDPDAWG